MIYMKKILVTGVGGQLGFDVVKALRASDTPYEVLGADIADFDITNLQATQAFIKNFAPDVVVHCSAYTAVDKAESEIELCNHVNVVGSKNIASVCRELGAQMVYISSDYVYNGQGTLPFEVTEPTNPLSVYGKSKLDGELAAAEVLKELYIIRTSWVFGANGNNFVKTMLRLGKERDSLSVVADQIGSPTYTPDLADFIVFLLQTGKFGVYHFSNEELCSWYEFAKEIFAQAGLAVEVKPIVTSEYKTAAQRPLNSRLSKKSVYNIGYSRIASWKDALKRYLAELKQV